MIFANFGLKVDLNRVISLDFLFKEISYANFGFEVMISSDFMSKVTIFAYFGLKVALK